MRSPVDRTPKEVSSATTIRTLERMCRSAPLISTKDVTVNPGRSDSQISTWFLARKDLRSLDEHDLGVVEQPIKER